MAGAGRAGAAEGGGLRVAVVVPNWNGLRWLPALLASLDAQTRAADAVIVVDNGSTDGSLAWLHAERQAREGARAAGGARGARAARDARGAQGAPGTPGARGEGAEPAARDRAALHVLALGRNTGFSVACNRGIAHAVVALGADAVALVNTDVELAPDWLARTVSRLAADAGLASVATKMVLMEPAGVVDDAGDVLRRDGVAEQRGHGRPDGPRFDTPGEVFSACAGAALYRAAPVVAVGGFDERMFAYAEDVDLGLRLRLAGWRCAYEPVVALHARHGSDGAQARPIDALVVRHTLLLVAKAFPVRWLPLVAYRQLSWARAAARTGRLRAYLRGVAGVVPLLPRAVLHDRRALRQTAVVPIAEAVPARPWRGPAAGGHPESPE